MNTNLLSLFWCMLAITFAITAHIGQMYLYSGIDNYEAWVKASRWHSLSWCVIFLSIVIGWIYSDRNRRFFGLVVYARFVLSAMIGILIVGNITRLAITPTFGGIYLVILIGGLFLINKKLQASIR